MLMFGKAHTFMVACYFVERHQLEAFEAVAEYRSFTRAAEGLHVTQSTVTRQIAALEADLKTRLFDRLGRTVVLTPSGEALRRYAEPILRLLGEAREAIRDIEAGTGGRLTVGASSTLATYVLPSLLKRFHDLHPGVEIAIQTGISARIEERTRAGEVDLGIVTTGLGERDNDPLLARLPLTELETVVVLPPGHALSLLESVPVEALAVTPLLLMEQGTNLRAYVERLLDVAGVEKQVAMELDNVEAIKRMIEANLGVSLLPLVAVKSEVSAGRLVALPLTGVARPIRRIALVYRQDKYLSAALRRFIALLQSEVQKNA